jgi:hypothetical protein
VVGVQRGAISLVSTSEELRERKVAYPVYKSETTASGSVSVTARHRLTANVGIMFPDKRRLFGSYGVQ